MANDTQLETPSAAGDTVRTIDDGTRKYPVSLICYASSWTSGSATLVEPVAAALADGVANPTVPAGPWCPLYVFNGTTWDRLVEGSVAGSLKADVVATVLPTGAATSANQDTANTHLSNIAGYLDTEIAAILTASQAVQAAVELLDNAISGSEMQVDVVTSALPSGAATEATLAAIQTAVEIIDDWDETNRAAVNLISGQAGVTGGSGVVGAATQRVTIATDDLTPTYLSTIDADTSQLAGVINSEDAPSSSGHSGFPLLAVRDDALADDAETSTDGDYTWLRVNNRGAVYTANENGGLGMPKVDSYTTASMSASAGTANQTLVSAPGLNKQIWVYGFIGSADTGDGSISIQDEDDTALSGVMPVAQNGGFSFPPSGNFQMPLWKVATNKALEIDTVTCGFKGTLTYGIIDVS